MKIPFDRREPAAAAFLSEKNRYMQMALLKEEKVITGNLGEIFIPLGSDGRYDLMIWQQGDQSGHVRLKAEALPVAHLDVGQELAMGALQAARIANSSGFGVRLRRSLKRCFFGGAGAAVRAPGGRGRECADRLRPGWHWPGKEACAWPPDP